MTRDEAVKKVEECFSFNHPSMEWTFAPLRLVAALENLGLLKMDEPKRPIRPMTIFCEEMRWPEGGASYQTLFNSLEKAGLKIVPISDDVGGSRD